MIEAARVCLPILEENVRLSIGGNELLRSSNEVLCSEEELLRPQPENSETPEEELLRVVDDGTE
jgi:hypothetical protein